MFKNGSKGRITYYAKKHNKTITREYKLDDKCKVEDDYIIYFDLSANNYRRANGSATITEVKKSWCKLYFGFY